MSATEILVPVLGVHDIAWPEKNPNTTAPQVEYLPIDVAFTREYPDDRHVSAYSVPDHPTRLRVEAATAHFPVPMVAMIVDVEPAGHAPRSDAWDVAEQPKIEKALTDGWYFYATRGGYRLVRPLAEPFVVANPHDAKRWSASYLAALDDVQERYGIVADRTCKDAGRLYRLPRVVRDGEVQHREMSDIATMRPHVLHVVDVPSTTMGTTVAPVPGEYGAASPELLDHLNEQIARGWFRPAIDGQRGDERTYSTCATFVHNYALAEDEAWPLLLKWNATCQPPWSEDELHTKMANASNYATGIYGDKREDWEAKQRFIAKIPAGKTATTSTLNKPQNTSTPGAPVPLVAAEPAPPLFRSISDIASIDVPPLRTYTTGLPELDLRLGGGMSTRALHVIISRTGAGKTGAALGVLIRNAKDGVPQLYVSTELDGNEAFLRVAAQLIHVPHRDLLMGKVPRDRARDAVRGLPIEIIGQEDLPRGSELATIGDAIAAVADKYGKTPIACVDYLQMLTDEDPHHVRMGVSAVANGLRAMSQRHDCVMIGVSSAARMFYRAPKEGADDPLSYLGAAKESGDIEFAAASILYLDVGESDPAGDHVSRIVVAKARRGTTGFVGTRFNGPTGCWTSSAEAAQQMSGEARRTRVTSAKYAEYETAILKAIVDASKQPGKPYRTRRAWRDMHALLKVPEKEIEPAITRLDVAGKVVLTSVHPKTHTNERYPLVVPATDPKLPPVGVLGVRTYD